jgi:hypothetical protein
VTAGEGPGVMSLESEAATVGKLINLPHQHALLVLRVCIQQNLRHLQRSLKSDDLVHLWDRLDAFYWTQRSGSEVSPVTPTTCWTLRSSPC